MIDQRETGGDMKIMNTRDQRHVGKGIIHHTSGGVKITTPTRDEKPTMASN